jgi:hypothetical protein
LKSNLKLIFFFVFSIWCTDATNLYTMLEVSESYQSIHSENIEDAKPTDYDTDYNLKLKKITFPPAVIQNESDHFFSHILSWHLIYIEVNSPPPDSVV